MFMPDKKTLEQLFIERESKHRKLVHANLLRMQGFRGLSKQVLIERANTHDQSKLLSPEKEAYQWVTWQYHCKQHDMAFCFSKEIEEVILVGRLHHVRTNRHHPEFYQNVNTMKLLDVVEMVCDWTAISQEQNIMQASCYDWAQTNLDNKWQFNPEMKNLIFEIIAELDQRNCKYQLQGAIND